MAINILVVHQSSDLYGSDRVLLALVAALNRVKYHPIVLLPVVGPLVSELAAASVECHVLPIARLSRATLSLRGLLGLPANLIRSIRGINRVLDGRSVDLVHSNTLAVLSGAIWARFYRVPHVWHVHEIILRPKFVRKVYTLLLSCFADCIICVSHATKENLLQDKPALARKIQVVWNGLKRDHPVDELEAMLCRQQMDVHHGEVLIAQLGRINRLKGQRLLVAAVDLLWHRGLRNLRILFVGSVVLGQEHYLRALQHDIEKSEARGCFIVKPFVNDVWSIWDACDIAVIPSTEPESFGMVALEAMAASKPIIATNHGGVTEIILHGETGLLVPPCDAAALADAIKLLADDKDLGQKMGREGELRGREVFSLVRHVANMVVVYERTMADN